MRIARSIQPVLASAALAVLVTSVAACGDDDDGAMAKREYIEAADELCQQAQDDLDEIPEAESFEDLAGQVEEAQTRYEELRAELDALGEPDEDADLAAEVLATLDDVIDSIDAVIDAAQAEDSEALEEALAAGEEVSDAGRAAAEEFGFEECGVDDDGDGDDTSSPADEEFPVIYEPSDADIAAIVPTFSEGAGNLFTEEESTCIVRFLLERVRLDDELPEALEDQAATACLTVERLDELGQDVEADG